MPPPVELEAPAAAASSIAEPSGWNSLERALAGAALALFPVALALAWWTLRRPLELVFLGWTLGAVALVLLASRRLPRLALEGLGLTGLAATAWLVLEHVPSVEVAQGALPWIRAAVALVALAAVVREHLFPKRWPSHQGFTLGTLGVTAVLGLWCFANLGAPQFVDEGQGRRTWLHHYDMRTYYPIAKYFPELRFDGVYAASVLAVAEDKGLASLDAQPLRDLRTHGGTTVAKIHDHLSAVRARFSPERWAELRADLGYFRRAMGDGRFLASMNDHGGNATPVWFLAARGLFAAGPASDASLWRGAIADLLLLTLAFLAIGWAWGARTALVAVTVFGAMDFYQFGTNWFGAALRHDWLSLWAIGLALLKRGKLSLAGAALAWAAWIRAFPALTLATAAIPPLAAALGALLQRRRSEAAAALAPLWRLGAGVAAASAALFGASLVVFGPAAWNEWLRKVQLLDAVNHYNNLSFRTQINSHPAAWVAACLLSLLLLAWLLRRAALWRAAVWGVPLLPVVFNPANYYLHSFFLLPTLGLEVRGERPPLRATLVWAALLAMCAASYFTNLTPEIALHFRLDTIVVFTALAAVLMLELEPGLRAWRNARRAVVRADPP